MASHESDRRFLKRSFGISAGLHLMLLPLLAFVAWPAFFGEEYSSPGVAATEPITISYTHAKPRARVPVKVVAARGLPAAAPGVPAGVAKLTAPAARLPAVRPAKATPLVVAAPRADVHRVVLKRAPEPAYRAAAPVVASAIERAAPARARSRIVATTQAASVTVAASTGAGAGATAPQAPALPAASPSPAPTATPPSTLADAPSAHGVEIPPGGWGQNFERPLVADESAIADLHARYHAVASASVEVDDTGHAVRVTLPSNVPDDARADIEHRLMALRYVPAECNGLHCAGTLQISL